MDDRADVKQLKSHFSSPALFLILFLTLILHATPSQAQSTSGETAACNFLFSLYNPYLKLLATNPLSRTYYVASDNLLANNVLNTQCARLNSTIGQNINSSLASNSCCHNGNSLMHEALFGRQITLPILTASLYNVTGSYPLDPNGNYAIWYEYHNGRWVLNDTISGDVAAYTALELELKGNHATALNEVDKIRRMYNGTGIIDDAFTNGGPGEKGVFQTFKIALYIIALAKTNQQIPADLEKNLLRMQAPDGGFNTGYDSQWNYKGATENVETTSIAMIALRMIPGTHATISGYGYNWPSGQSPSVFFRFRSDENWTRNFNVNAQWDSTTIGNQTIIGVSPGQDVSVTFTSNLHPDIFASHNATVRAGSTSVTWQPYSSPTILYLLILGVVVAAGVPVFFLLRRSKKKRHLPQP